MRYVRRHDLSPRVEMTPLIDVVFLLLTFFIYALVVMVQAQVLPVRLSKLRTGKAAKPGQVEAITIDAAGRLYLNRQPISPKKLTARLTTLAKQKPPPPLYLAMEVDKNPLKSNDQGAAPSSASNVDRGPILIKLIEQVRHAGLTNFTIVGEPDGS